MELLRAEPRFLAACSATLLYFSAGSLTGWASSAGPRLLDARRPGQSLSISQVTWVVSVTHLGHMATALPAAALADRAGRKVALWLGALPFAVSWLLTFLAGSLFADDPAPKGGGVDDYYWPVDVALLVVARVVGGVGAGVAYTVGAMYLGEVAPDHVRGAVSTLFQIASNAGVLLEYCMGPYLSYALLNAVSAVAPVLFILTFSAAPESPYYLLLKGDREGAEEVLTRLRGAKPPEEILKELQLMERTVEVAKEDKGHVLALLTTDCNRRAFVLCLGLVTIAQFSGHIAVLSYATSIFQLSRSTLDPHVSAITLGVVQVLMSAVSSSLVDTAGRRPLLLVSCVGCSLSLFIEGLFFYYPRIELFYWVPLTAMIVFLISYTLGLGSVPGAIIGEVFPTHLKGLATSIISVYAAGLSFVIVKLMVAVEYEMFVMFWLFSAITLVGIVFVIFLVPETKGKSMLDVYYQLKVGFPFCGKSKEKQKLLQSDASHYDS